MDRLNVDQLKRDAKKLGKRNTIDYQTALDMLAQEQGFTNWLALREEHRRQIAEDNESQPPSDSNAHLPAWR